MSAEELREYIIKVDQSIFYNELLFTRVMHARADDIRKDEELKGHLITIFKNLLKHMQLQSEDEEAAFERILDNKAFEDALCMHENLVVLEFDDLEDIIVERRLLKNIGEFTEHSLETSSSERLKLFHGNHGHILLAIINNDLPEIDDGNLLSILLADDFLILKDGTHDKCDNYAVTHGVSNHVIKQ